MHAMREPENATIEARTLRSTSGGCADRGTSILRNERKGDPNLALVRWELTPESGVSDPNLSVAPDR
jgi:hypothetical protein